MSKCTFCNKLICSECIIQDKYDQHINIHEKYNDIINNKFKPLYENFICNINEYNHIELKNTKNLSNKTKKERTTIHEI